jgi:ABC-2 type transport system ATP-binding protein
MKGKITILLTTHYMEEAEALSDRIAIMRDGNLLVADTAQSIKAMTGADRFEDAFVTIVKGVQP